MPTTPDEFVAALFVIIVLGALAIVGIGRVVVWAARLAERRRPSIVSSGGVARYVERERPLPAPRVVTSGASRVEVEAEAVKEAVREGAGGIVTLTEKALQEKERDAYEQGMIAAFAAFEKRGYIPKGKATELKEALFQVSGGRKLQALNRQIDAVVVEVPPVPAEEPAEPRLVAISEGKGGYVEL